MNRRDFLVGIAAGTAWLTATGATTACSTDLSNAAPAPSPSPPPVTPHQSQPAGPVSAVATETALRSGLLPPDVAKRIPLPDEPITALPGPGRHLALTVDDGADSEVVGAYIRFAQDTGARFTFFVTGSFDSWTYHKAALAPLVDSGQIQLGNHSWTHADLTSLSPAGVADELGRTKKFLRNTFGVDGTPYYRPPFGYHDATVDKVAADLGYTMPTLWYGSLSDSGLITEKYLLHCARKYFRPQTIIIGHANHAPVTKVYPQLVEILRARRLRLVTLDDYFAADG